MAPKGSSSTASRSNSSPYAAAAKLLSQIIEEKKSFKKLVYSKDGKLRCTKTAYAQVCQVLSYKNIIDQLFDQVPSLPKDVHNTGLLHVLVYELLFGPNKKINGGGAVKRKIVQHEKALRRVLETKELSKQLETFETHSQRCFPRYARINTLLTTAKEVCTGLLAEVKKEAVDTKAPSLEFYMDPHVPNLLVLPPSIIAHVMASADDNQEQSPVLARQQRIIKSMIQSGKLILQDKSSCFSALCLVLGYGDEDVKVESDFMDACAAPGNKTQHLATLVASNPASTGTNKKNVTAVATPTVYAVDRSPERLATLSDRMKQLVPTTCRSGRPAPGIKVITKEEDFLKVEPKDFKKVGSILLDPSCSGSGIYTAPDRWTETTKSITGAMDEEVSNRIEPLANFQEMALCHAMSFPSVFRIVYSTCSLHDRENEVVVMRAVSKFNVNEEATDYSWHTVAPKCLGNWKRRGHVVDGSSPEDAKCMIRAINKDDTNGFFVCCLEKRKKGDTARSSSGDRSAGKPAVSQIVVPKGVDVYNGQFSKKTEPVKVARKQVKQEKTAENPDSNRAPEAASEEKKQKAAASKKAASKKRDKKLAWKKRQMEQKQDRLRQKKLKTAEDY